MRRFDQLHPVVLILYFLMILAPIMLYMDIIMIIIAFVTGVLVYILWNHTISPTAMVADMILAVMIILVNALILRQGEHPLFYVNGLAIYEEGIFYGIRTAGMLIAALTWCAVLSRMLTGDSVMTLLRHLPKTALLITMVLRLVPRYLRRYQNVSMAMKVNGQQMGRERVNLLVRVSAVFTWSLENAMQTAKAMEDRGYRKPGRVSLRHRWQKRDSIVTGILMITQAGYLVSGWLPMAVLGLLPVIYQIKEEVRWAIYQKHNL